MSIHGLSTSVLQPACLLLVNLAHMASTQYQQRREVGSGEWNTSPTSNGLENTSSEFQSTVKSITEFKNDSDHKGLNPIQQVARDNEKENKVANVVAGGVAAAGKLVAKFPHPVAKGIGYTLYGGATAAKVVYNDAINKTDPEKIRIHPELNKN